ncbi:heavy metal-associated isoprenylated plant protein 2-like [Rutidosis leptorrhynchoides]|uniref:heavy metal-associated isoprenylated plant protein 2-like n=1 Tax=Rutidosis leptorrhynchoides TaxID=125765 RepID=UPI003A99B3BC
MSFMTKKTVLSVDLRCLKCRKKLMMKISSIEGIDLIVLDPSKNIVTVIGEADPMKVVRKVRKFRSSAQVVTVGPAKEEKKDEKKVEKKDEKNVEKKDDKKDTSAHTVVHCSTPRTCHSCDVWYVVSQDYVSPCHIL